MRVLLFQIKEPLKEPVILCIGYLRIIQAVIAVIVIANTLAELLAESAPTASKASRNMA